MVEGKLASPIKNKRPSWFGRENFFLICAKSEEKNGQLRPENLLPFSSSSMNILVFFAIKRSHFRTCAFTAAEASPHLIFTV